MPIVTIPPALQRAVDRVRAWPPVVQLFEILAAYGEAGGGLLAAGLAYSALSAALTGLLFVVGIVGFVVHDPVARESLIQSITAQVPPLEPIVRDGLLKVADNAGALSLLGVAGLGWSASQFYGAIDGAFARIFRRAPERGPLVRIFRGLVSLLIVTVAIAAAIVTASVHAILAQDLPAGPAGDAARVAFAIGFPLLAIAMVIGAVALLYRLVPNTHVPWRSLRAPAILAGLVIAIIAELFVFIAPRLVGALQVFGGAVAVFAALAWLSWSFQALLVGAAWTRIRMPADSVSAGPRPEEVTPEGTAAPAPKPRGDALR